jgi:hypothetical protein
MDNQDDPNMPIPPVAGDSSMSDDAAPGATDAAPQAESAFPTYQTPSYEPPGTDAMAPESESESADAGMTPPYDAASFDPTPPAASAMDDTGMSVEPAASAAASDASAASAAPAAPASSGDAADIPASDMRAPSDASDASDASASIAPEAVVDAVSPVSTEAGGDQPAMANDAGAAPAAMDPTMSEAGAYAAPDEQIAPMDSAPMDSAPMDSANEATQVDVAPMAPPPPPMDAVPPPPVPPAEQMAPPASEAPPAYTPPPPPPVTYAPPMAPPAPQFQGYAPVAPMMAPRREKTVPILLEVIPGLFGLFGIGWLVSGYTSTGLLLLIGGLVFDVVMGIITVFTLGIGFLCWGPLIVVIMIVSAVMLNRRLDMGM